jgi:protoheme IX farnesyltransferase
VLLFWQIPHFMAIAWTYRRDYAGVNFPMLPVRDTGGGKVARWSFLNTVLVVICAAVPSFRGLASGWYLGLTDPPGLLVHGRAICVSATRRPRCFARRFFFASIGWLPLQLGGLVADRCIFF